MGFSYKKPKHIPGKANQKAQEEFIEKYNELKDSKSPEDQNIFYGWSSSVT